MEHNSQISEKLRLPKDAILYSMGEALAALRPDKTVLHGEVYSFDVDEYAGAGHCELRANEHVFNDIATQWHGDEHPLSETVHNGWHFITWQGHEFELVRITLQGSHCPNHYYWLIGDSRERTETFYVEVCRWNTAIREEVWIFEGGGWNKSKKLFSSIKDATFDRLIMESSFRNELQADFRQFFDSREVYARYRVPWKRGVLFLGPPGNGKTYTVKALINWLGVTCLYVKSFKSQYGTEHSSIRSVFELARKTTPCILVFEDLDSLINDKNRSYFLNEMDGFMSNDGVFVLATTNHPERLDPAILDRPSRFDRKYSFELPSAALRETYLRSWNDTAEAELQLSPTGLAATVAQTDSFSFAYLKELWLSSMMRWINSVGIGGAAPGSMDDVIAAQIVILREQMTAAKQFEPKSLADIPNDIASFASHLPSRIYTQYMRLRGMGVDEGGDDEEESDDD